MVVAAILLALVVVLGVKSAAMAVLTFLGWCAVSRWLFN